MQIQKYLSEKMCTCSPIAKVTEISKPSSNPFCFHITRAISPCPEQHLREEPFLSLPEERKACQRLRKQLKKQIHFSFSATCLWKDLFFCWKTELDYQMKARKSLIYRQELLLLSTAGKFSKAAWHHIPKLRAYIPGLSFKHPYWQTLTDAPEILKPSYTSQSSRPVVIIWLFWSLHVQPALKCSRAASNIFRRFSLGK